MIGRPLLGDSGPSGAALTADRPDDQAQLAEAPPATGHVDDEPDDGAAGALVPTG
ncbi:hypothetical protein [Pseudonocardia sp.]|uniref:hypothetical protein n=1 Tax=Pseudonocardia sp. TaxID=60912 RepID=UPI00262C4113|nr:hypothetical protein [Pseudonocardia sp.]